VLYFAIVIAATISLMARTERRLKILRGVLWLTLIVSIVCGTLIVFEPPLNREGTGQITDLPNSGDSE
jgi:hypothetical protein